MNKKLQINIMGLSDIDVYLAVLDGSLNRFPHDFLCKNTCKRILRWLCLEHYRMPREEICNLNQNFLFSNSLGSFRRIFNYNMFSLIQYTFPELDIKYWETAKVPNGFWNDKENQKDFIKWIAEKENIDLNSLNDVSLITSNMLDKYGGSKARMSAGGTYELISSATGNRYKEWEILKIDIWTEEKAKKAVKWLIEEKLKWSDEQIRTQLKASVFQENYLGGLLKNYCGNSPIRAINLAYPGKFKSIKYSNV